MISRIVKGKYLIFWTLGHHLIIHLPSAKQHPDTVVDDKRKICLDTKAPNGTIAHGLTNLHDEKCVGLARSNLKLDCAWQGVQSKIPACSNGKEQERRQQFPRALESYNSNYNSSYHSCIIISYIFYSLSLYNCHHGAERSGSTYKPGGAFAYNNQHEPTNN